MFLLFLQSFQLREWLDTPTPWGRLVEVNWPSTHIDTGSGMQIMPNSVLAGASFTNLSQPAGAHKIMITTTFSLVDPPDVVCVMLNRVANMLLYRKSEVAPVSVAVGADQDVQKIGGKRPMGLPEFLQANKTAILALGMDLDDKKWTR